MEEKQLIEKLRGELKDLIKKTDINNSKVIAKSQKLDKLMLNYQKRLLKKKKSN